MLQLFCLSVTVTHNRYSKVLHSPSPAGFASVQAARCSALRGNSEFCLLQKVKHVYYILHLGIESYYSQPSLLTDPCGLPVSWARQGSPLAPRGHPRSSLFRMATCGGRWRVGKRLCTYAYKAERQVAWPSMNFESSGIRVGTSLCT